MTDTKETKEPTAEEIAAAEETRVNDLAAAKLKGQAASDEPLRMVDDVYLGVVSAARRYNQGNGDVGAVQAELDSVFGKGKVKAADVVTEPEPAEDSKATAKK